MLPLLPSSSRSLDLAPCFPFSRAYTLRLALPACLASFFGHFLCVLGAGPIGPLSPFSCLSLLAVSSTARQQQGEPHTHSPHWYGTLPLTVSPRPSQLCHTLHNASLPSSPRHTPSNMSVDRRRLRFDVPLLRPRPSSSQSCLGTPLESSSHDPAGRCTHDS